MAKKATTPKAAAKAKKIGKLRSLRRSAGSTGKMPSSDASNVALKPSKRKKTHLTKGELSEFRNMLLEKRRALIGDMNGIQAGALGVNRQDGSGDLSNMPTHPADIGTDNYEHEFTLGLLESERALLNEINEALERIENRTYGICLGTGQPIDKARLRARPWAKYCIEYAKMIEKGLVRPGQEPDEVQDSETSEEEDEE